MSAVLAIFLFGLLFSYGLFIRFVMRGLEKKRPKAEPIRDFPSFSILVPFRNEENHIGDLLDSIDELDYPRECFELLFIDDHSSDDGRLKIESFAGKHPSLNLQIIKAEGQGKKAALYSGMSIAQHELIYQTDADCRLPKGIFHHLASAFQDPRIKLVAGPLRLAPVRGFMDKLQEVDVASLIASSIGMSRQGWHIMSNAANMAYRKDAYLEYRGKEESASGDDVFLFQRVGLADEQSVVYLTEPGAMVTTRPQDNLVSLFQQRMRWASKSREYPNKKGIWIGLCVFMINVAMMLVLALAVFGSLDWYLVAAWFVTRMTLDGALISRFYDMVMKEKMRMLPFTVQSLINPFYVIMIGILSQVLRYKWKGRSYR